MHWSVSQIYETAPIAVRFSPLETVSEALEFSHILKYHPVSAGLSIAL